ncbi:MAG TPA: hypothetical protein VGS07_18440 [Thermoanaerobaculia bacterium]|nr:hypothetical protein [Thermoanaerobaculia bacterium]
MLVWLARVTGLSAAPGMRGGAEDASGDVWLQEAAGGPLHRLTRDGGYSWPVFSADDLQVIAIRGGDLWALPVDGAPPVKLASAPEGLVSLVGSGPDGLVVLIADKIGTFSPETGAFSPFEPTSQEERNEIVRLRSPARSYSDRRLNLSERNGVVVVESAGRRREIVGDGAAAMQPSASHTLDRIVFITPSAAPS